MDFPKMTAAPAPAKSQGGAALQQAWATPPKSASSQVSVAHVPSSSLTAPSVHTPDPIAHLCGGSLQQAMLAPPKSAALQVSVAQVPASSFTAPPVHVPTMQELLASGMSPQAVMALMAEQLREVVLRHVEAVQRDGRVLDRAGAQRGRLGAVRDGVDAVRGERAEQLVLRGDGESQTESHARPGEGGGWGE